MFKRSAIIRESKYGIFFAKKIITLTISPKKIAICLKHVTVDYGQQICLPQSSHLEKDIVDIRRLLCTMLLISQVAAFLYPLDNNFVISRRQSLVRLKEKIDPLSKIIILSLDEA